MRQRQLKIDDLDRKICVLLQEDGGRSYSAIAKMMKVSAATVRRRVTRLVKAGAMKLTALPQEHSLLGFDTSALIALDVAAPRVRAILDDLARHPEVTFAARVTGRYDVLAWVILESLDNLARYLERLGAMPGVAQTETMVVLHTAKRLGGRFR